MTDRQPKPRPMLIEAALQYAEVHLGPLTCKLVREERVQKSIAKRVSDGARLEDALLAEVHRASATTSGIANEFLAHLLPDLQHAGKRVRPRGLRHLFDTNDLVQSAMGDLWPTLREAEFQTRAGFLALMKKRVGWKAADRARGMGCAKRREDRRVEQDLSDIQHPASEESPIAALLQDEENAQVLRRIARMPERSRLLLTGMLNGKSIATMALELEISTDATRASLKRAIAHMRLPEQGV